MNFIAEMAEKFEFPVEASVFLGECFEKMMLADGGISELYMAMDNLFCDKDNRYLEILENISAKSGVGFHSSLMVLLLMSAKSLYYIYKQNNLSDKLFFDTMADLKYKLSECKRVYNEWGTFSNSWFSGIYKLGCFKIGRLQYARCVSDFSYKDALEPGDPVFACHIPSEGPLDNDEVIKSLKEAKSFFADCLRDGKFVVSCNSWLLYTPIITKLRETSNIRRFYNLFDIIAETHDPSNSDFWRVFDVHYSPEITDAVPVDNSLKQIIVSHLKDGGTMGLGQGIIVL